MSAKKEKKYENNGVCIWKNEKCNGCNDSNPFETENFCHAAVKIFMAENHTVCPQCRKGKMKMNREHTLVCPLCSCHLDIKDII